MYIMVGHKVISKNISKIVKWKHQNIKELVKYSFNLNKFSIFLNQ